MTRREYAIIMEQFADMNSKLNDIMEALEVSPTKHEDKEWFTAEQEVDDELPNIAEGVDMTVVNKALVDIDMEEHEDYVQLYGKLVYNPQSDKLFVTDDDCGYIYKISKYDSKYIHSGGFAAGNYVSFSLRESATDNTMYAVIV